MVYLFGCDHNCAQTYSAESALDDPQNETQRQFRELLVKAIEEYDPALIAEERHPDVLRLLALRSVAFEAATDKRIPHRFCEPSSMEKNDLGIDGGPPTQDLEIDPDIDPFLREQPLNIQTGSTHDKWRRYIGHHCRIREEFWIDQLGEELNKRVFFVIGAHHRETLRRKLQSRGFEVRIVKDAKRVGICKSSMMPKVAFDAYKDIRRNGFSPVS